MLKKQKWLQNIGAVATERGWEHPDSGELLVAVKGLLKFYTPDGEQIKQPKIKEVVEDDAPITDPKPVVEKPVVKKATTAKKTTAKTTTE